MNTATYTYLLDNPQNIKDQHLEQLGGVVNSYPFFQSARALQLKALKDRDSYLYNEALKKTAAYTTDRDILFEYITSEDFVQNKIAQEIQQNDRTISEIEVISEDVSELVSIELDNRIKAELKKAEAILNPDLFERKVASVEKLVVEAETITPEETLELDKPLEFKKEDTHSFGEWLKLTKATPIDRSNEYVTEEVKDGKTRKFELIDRFIQDRPKIVPKDTPKSKKNLAKPYIQTPDILMTETLAKVYVQQKNYKKALQAYNILILKYPEKSGFFADQIRAIQNLIKTEDS